MIDGYANGADITLMNTFYQKPKKDMNTGKYTEDVLTIVYRDNVTGETKHQDIINPTYEFYIANENYITDEPELFAYTKDLTKVSCLFKDLEKTIAEITDNKEFYYNNLKNRTSGDNKQLHSLKEIYNSDMDIEDYYRMMFARKYTNRTIKIYKGFLDIETDNIKDSSDFPELGKFPINAVTYIDEKTESINVYILRTSELPNPQIAEFEDKVRRDPKGMVEQLRNFVTEKIGGWKQAVRYKIDNYSIHYNFFDEEIIMIGSLFKLINEISPDFMLAWNMPFDIPYITERIKVLGYDPAEIMCHPDFKHKVVRYYIDELHTEFKKKTSTFTVMGNTAYIDQLVNFASRRAGTTFINYKLDYIGMIIAKVRKVDYSNITNKIPELPYKNFMLFIFYNVMDVVVQKAIEIKTADIDYMYSKCLLNFTRYEKCHRQTIYLVNRATDEFYKQGVIIGNNINKFLPKPEEKFVGALVGDPKLTNNYSRLTALGRVINVCKNLDDFDFKSLYPSETLQHNIGLNTQIGKIIIDQIVWTNENMHNADKYDRGGQFIEDLHSANYIEFANRWLHFANYFEMLQDISEYFTYIASARTNMDLMFNPRGLRQPFIDGNHPLANKAELNCPIGIIREEDRGKLVCPIVEIAPEINYASYIPQQKGMNLYA